MFLISSFEEALVGTQEFLSYPASLSNFPICRTCARKCVGLPWDQKIHMGVVDWSSIGSARMIKNDWYRADDWERIE